MWLVMAILLGGVIRMKWKLPSSPFPLTVFIKESDRFSCALDAYNVKYYIFNGFVRQINCSNKP